MTHAVRIGILDSGVTEGHPHLPRVAGGVGITSGGTHPDFRDVLGHGTAVASLIHYLAPDAELLSIKIFDRHLATTIAAVLRGLEWCLENQIDIVNLSLGTANPDHRDSFTSVISRLRSAGSVLVSAYRANGSLMLPGSMPGIVGVTELPDATCQHMDFDIIDGPTPHVAACPYPREIAGVPRENNLHGVSFAVAHVSSMIARRWDQRDGVDTNWLQLLRPEMRSTRTGSQDALQ